MPWMEEVCYKACGGTQAGISVAVILIGMAVLILLGAAIRRRLAKWRIIQWMRGLWTGACGIVGACEIGVAIRYEKY